MNFMRVRSAKVEKGLSIAPPARPLPNGRLRERIQIATCFCPPSSVVKDPFLVSLPDIQYPISYRGGRSPLECELSTCSLNAGKPCLRCVVCAKKQTNERHKLQAGKQNGTGVCVWEVLTLPAGRTSFPTDLPTGYLERHLAKKERIARVAQRAAEKTLWPRDAEQALPAGPLPPDVRVCGRG